MVLRDQDFLAAACALVHAALPAAVAVTALADVAAAADGAVSMIHRAVSGLAGEVAVAAAQRQMMRSLGKELPAGRTDNARFHKDCRDRCRTGRNDQICRPVLQRDDPAGRSFPARQEIARIRGGRQQHHAACGISVIRIMNRAACSSFKADLMQRHIAEVRHNRHILRHRKAIDCFGGYLPAIHVPSEEAAAADRIGLQLRVALIYVLTAAQHLPELIAAFGLDGMKDDVVAAVDMIRLNGASARADQAIIGSRTLRGFVRVFCINQLGQYSAQRIAGADGHIRIIDNKGVLAANDVELVDRAADRAVTGRDDLRLEFRICGKVDHHFAVRIDCTADSVHIHGALAADDGSNQRSLAVIDQEINRAVHAHDTHRLGHVGSEGRIGKIGILRTQPSHGNLGIMGLNHVRAGQRHHQIQHRLRVIHQHGGNHVHQRADSTDDIRIPLRLGNDLLQPDSNRVHAFFKGLEVQLNNGFQNVDQVGIAVLGELRSQRLDVV